MLIVLTNTKGGVGKSTLAAHLVLWLHDRGVRVALLDTDEQQTAARWVKGAEPKVTVAVATDVESIRAARAKLLRSHDVIVADSPGSGTEASHAITMLADLAIVPLQPSKPDIRAVKDALKFVRLAREMSGGHKPDAKIVLTFTAKGDVQARKLRSELSALDVPVTRSEIRRLNAFRDACDSAVHRLSSREASEAAKDIESLFVELLSAKLPGFAAAPIKEAANG
ncbi:MAG: ParA family protein [Pirellulales bacterium]|nr:ParA family protein [Pirellulales bacterium]